MSDLAQDDIDWINQNVKEEATVPLANESYEYNGEESKKRGSNGGKGWQRADKEDRTIPYKVWINSNNSNGFWLDADAIKWRKVDGKFQPFMITELTASSSERVPNQKYLDSIVHRIFTRDTQGHVLKQLGCLLGIPVYWVLFPPSVSWIYVFSCNKMVWKQFTPEEWLEFCRQL